MATYRDAQDEIAALRQELAEVQAELEHLRKAEAAARRVTQLVSHNVDVLNVGAAVRDLRKVLDERGGGG